MKITKKLTAFLLTLILCASLLPSTLALGSARPNEHQTISSGACHLMFIDSDGTLYGTGNGYSGQLGDGTNSYTTTPKIILKGVTDVSCGYNFTAAITSDGSLWTWGDNSHGQLGTGNTANSTVPVKVLSDAKSVCCSNDPNSCFVVAVKTDGTLWTWGDSDYGQNGSRNNYCTPIRVFDKVATASCGTQHIAALKTDGTLWVWGGNTSGQLGLGTYTNYRADPVKVMDRVAAVSCGTYYTAAIKTDGSLWTWGANEYGQLGTGNQTATNSPTRILKNVSVTSVSCGNDHTAAVTNDNKLYVWGSQNNGQLGSNMGTSDSIIAYPTRTVSGVSAVYCGLWDTIMLGQNGTIWTAGYNGNSSLGYSGGDTYVANSGYYAQTIFKKIEGFTVKLPDERPTSVAPNTPPSSGYIPGYTPSTTPSSTGTTNVGHVGNFTDVSSSAYYAKAVKWAVDRGVTSGTSTTTFSPDKECSLAEMVTMLWRANGKPSSSTRCPFSLQPSNPYYTPFCWAEEKGILDRSGISTTTVVTRKMMIMYLWRANDSQTTNHIASFNDVPRTANYATALTWAVDCGIASGYPDGNFYPDSLCTRAQIVTFLYNTYR